MVVAFSQIPDDFRQQLIKNIKAKKIKNADEILSAIKEFRYEIQEQIQELESTKAITEAIDIQLAILIRQDQYLACLENMQKYELAEIFAEFNNNSAVPEVFKWYKG